MKIKELTLYTNKLQEQRKFYCDVFGFVPVNEDTSFFSIQVGFTLFTFKESLNSFLYHYCFLIPSNKIQQSIEWLKNKVDIISYENGRLIEPGPVGWNSDSIYFYDAAGNISEFIVRHDLNNSNIAEKFDSSQILCVNEIGMPSDDIQSINLALRRKMSTSLWYGDLNRFAAIGTQNGLFLLLNYENKKTWFPSAIFPSPSPFNGVFESGGSLFELTFEDGRIISINHQGKVG